MNINEGIPAKIKVQTKVTQNNETEDFVFDLPGQVVKMGDTLYIRYKEIQQDGQEVPVTVKVMPDSQVQLIDRTYLPNTAQQTHLESKETQLLRIFFDEVLSDFKRVQQKESLTQEFIDNNVARVTQMMDEFIFQGTYEKEESLYSVLTYHIRQTLDMMYENYGFEQDGNRVVSLASYLYLKDNTDILSSHYEWQEQKNELLEFLDSFLETPFWYAKKLLTYLSQQLDQQILEEDIVFVTFYFYSLQISDLPNDVKCIVLAHGYSTASSLANVVNRMLGKNVFQAYDMPINITLDKVEAQIIRYINDYRTDSGLIDPDLMLWRYARIHRIVVHFFSKLFITQLVQLCTG